MFAKVAQMQFQVVLDARNEQVSRLGELPTTAEPSSPTRGRETLDAALNFKRRYVWVSGRISGILAGPPKVVSVMDLKQARGKKLYDFAGSTGLINGVPTTAGSFTFTVQVKDETRATYTETFTIEILPPRGADDHHRGALQRNGRRVLLLRQPVRQRWCPALYLVRGRRDPSSRLVPDWMPTQGPR
jgi:Putative Ig domain